METHNAFDAAKSIAPLNNSENNKIALDDQLLEIYWAKKELEEFLPKIATYATPKEIVAITLSQLSLMENHIITILKLLSRKQSLE